MLSGTTVCRTKAISATLLVAGTIVWYCLAGWSPTRPSLGRSPGQYCDSAGDWEEPSSQLGLKIGQITPETVAVAVHQRDASKVSGRVSDGRWIQAARLSLHLLAGRSLSEPLCLKFCDQVELPGEAMRLRGADL